MYPEVVLEGGLAEAEDGQVVVVGLAEVAVAVVSGDLVVEALVVADQAAAGKLG